MFSWLLSNKLTVLIHVFNTTHHFCTCAAQHIHRHVGSREAGGLTPFQILAPPLLSPPSHIFAPPLRYNSSPRFSDLATSLIHSDPKVRTIWFGNCTNTKYLLYIGRQIYFWNMCDSFSKNGNCFFRAKKSTEISRNNQFFFVI